MNISIVNYDEYLSLCKENNITDTEDIFSEDSLLSSIEREEKVKLSRMKYGESEASYMYDGLRTIVYEIDCDESDLERFFIRITDVVNEEDQYRLEGYEQLVEEWNEKEIPLPPPAESAIKDWTNLFILSDMVKEDGTISLGYDETMIGRYGEPSDCRFLKTDIVFEIIKQEEVTLIKYRKIVLK